MKNFDIVTVLLALAGRIAQRRAEAAVRREATLLALAGRIAQRRAEAAVRREAARAAYGKAVEHRVNTNWRHQDIKRVS